jgi:hypothetical protein
MDDPFYRAIVREKRGHLPPDDRPLLDALEQRRSLLDLFLAELEGTGVTEAWRANATRFLAVCKAHAAGYAIHHQRLVRPFLEKPAMDTPVAHGAGVTSSGPPLDEVIAKLQRLLDLRTARPRAGITNAAASLARIAAHTG